MSKWYSPFFPFPGLDTDRLQQERPTLLVNIWDVSHLNNIKDTDSRAGCSICSCNGSVQHDNPCLRKVTSLQKTGISHEVLDTCNHSLHLLTVSCNPIESYSEGGMSLRRNPHHNFCQIEDLKTTDVRNHRRLI